MWQDKITLYIKRIFILKYVKDNTPSPVNCVTFTFVAWSLQFFPHASCKFEFKIVIYSSLKRNYISHTFDEL